MLRILLVGDNTLFRESLSAQFVRCAEIATVLEAGDGPTAVQTFAEHRPEVVLIEVSMGDANAFDIARAILEIDRGARIIFLGRQAFDSDVNEALRVEAKGFILKCDGLAVLSQAIASVAKGGMFFSEPIRKRLGIENGQLKLCRPFSPAVAGLTPRERELLTYLGQGASLKEAAAVMDVSYKTADNQKVSLMRKLDIHDRVELARFAIREGLVSLGPRSPKANPSPPIHATAP